ncbi:MAG: hypothetical protein OEM06_02030 [Desulfobacteraceae bacterium]|nr:hypothetical protein [Desulfobacteraceae bacterium]MDH3575644.1 hypothetical protein [Desulfobacteraceae bacterium]
MIRENKNNSQRQTFLSVVILSILMVIGAGIFITQSHFNPGILQQDALLSEPNKDKLSSQLSPNPSFVPLPEGIEPLTSTEIFDTRNLSDKINGKAELYLSAGFNRLVSQRFRDDRATDLWMEAFVYDMGNSQNAFSVFSAQRRQDAESLGLAQYAYRTPNALFLIHGRYYVEIITSKVSGQVLQPVRMMAETFIRNTPSEATAVNEMALFPKQELVKNSMVLISSDAFGYDGFDKIYTAEYEFDDHRLMAYLSHRRTPEQAKELASNYTVFLLAYGGQKIEAQLPIKGARLIEILDTYEIVFSHGSYLAGIREAATIKQAKTLAIRLYHRIKEGGNES